MWKHFVGFIRVPHIFLDAKVEHAQIKMQSGGHTHRTEIGRAMGTCAHVIDFGKVGNSSQVGNALGVDDCSANIVNQLFLNQLLTFLNDIENFTDSEWSRSVTPN